MSRISYPTNKVVFFDSVLELNRYLSEYTGMVTSMTINFAADIFRPTEQTIYAAITAHHPIEKDPITN